MLDSIWAKYHSHSKYGMQVLPQEIERNNTVSSNLGIINRPEDWAKQPRIVYYIWCQTESHRSIQINFFEFRHFLSVQSILRFLNPDMIFVYYNQLPPRDKPSYMTWFEELGESFPFVVRGKLSESDMCLSSGRVNPDFVLRNLSRPGSMVVLENTLFTSTPDPPLGTSVTNLLRFKTSSGYLASGPHSIPLKSLPLTNKRDEACVVSREYDSFSSIRKYTCIQLEPLKRVTTSDVRYMMRPDTILHGSSPFLKLCRWLMYGQEGIPTPAYHPEPVIPRLAHYVWFGGGEMDHLFYLSVLSCIYILKLDMVYIHGDLPPGGANWDLVSKHSSVFWVYLPRTRVVYEQRLDNIEHEADIAAVHAVLKYGGVHVDPDVLFWQPFPEEYWHYDSVAAPNRKYSRFYPFYINIGLFLARPGSQFWSMVELAERRFKQEEWNWNSARLLLKIYERNPQLLKISPHLQVMCAGTTTNECYPHWPEATDPAAWALNVTDWIDMAYSYHLNTPTPPELFTMQANIESNTVFAKMGKRILQAANLL